MIPRFWADASYGLGTNDLRVSIALFSFGGGPQSECFPSLDTLARITKLTTRSVRRIVRRLEAKGLIRCILRPGKTTLYEILIPPQGEDAQDVRPDTLRVLPSRSQVVLPPRTLDRPPTADTQGVRLVDQVVDHLEKGGREQTMEGIERGLALLREQFTDSRKASG